MTMREMVENLESQTTPPSIAEQYRLLLERFEPGTPSSGFEFITFPGWLSFPSKSCTNKFLLGPHICCYLSQTSLNLARDTILSCPLSIIASPVVLLYVLSIHVFACWLCCGLIFIWNRQQHSTSNDPTAAPEIDPHYFERDIGVLIRQDEA